MKVASKWPEGDPEVEKLKRFMILSPKEKLEYLEELNRFLSLAMPEKNKKIWKKLKELGW